MLIKTPGRWLARPREDDRVRWAPVRSTPGEVTIEPDEVYRFEAASSMTDEEFLCLSELQSLTNLQSISFSRCENLLDEGLKNLEKISALQELDLSNCLTVNDFSLAHLRRMTGLKRLNLSNCEQITDSGLAHLRRLTGLERLDLSYCRRVTDIGLAQLSEHTELRFLDLHGCEQVTDAGLERLAALTELAILYLLGCKRITASGIAQIKARNPLCIISWSDPNEIDRRPDLPSESPSRTTVSSPKPSVLVIESESPNTPITVKEYQVVLLIHGIRTHAEWQGMVREMIAVPGQIEVIPIGYGYFDVFRFWFPFWTRNGPIERVHEEIRVALQKYRKTHPDAKLSIIAHSFGTYIVGKILQRHFDLQIHRLILCGSVLPQLFPWNHLQGRFDDDKVVNECGQADIWPVLAKSLSWGYGASGTHGFGAVLVKDRFHEGGHGQYFEKKFVKTYWGPFIRRGEYQKSEFDTKRPPMPWWLSVLGLVPIKWLLVLLVTISLIVFLNFVSTVHLVSEVRQPAPPPKQTSSPLSQTDRLGYIEKSTKSLHASAKANSLIIRVKNFGYRITGKEQLLYTLYSLNPSGHWDNVAEAEYPLGSPGEEWSVSSNQGHLIHLKREIECGTRGFLEIEPKNFRNEACYFFIFSIEHTIKEKGGLDEPQIRDKFCPDQANSKHSFGFTW
jgi:pimeloyl-ACP methyl ester carboxylesterase